MQVDELVSPVTVSSIPTLAPQSPEILRIRRVLKALSLEDQECDYCEGSSSDRSRMISECMVDFAGPNIWDMDYDSLVERNVFISLQALHFSSAISRAKQTEIYKERKLREELTAWKDAFCRVEADLELEKSFNDEDLLELERTCAELKVAKESLKSSEDRMFEVLTDYVTKLEEVAVQHTLMTRISMMLEPEDIKATWNVREEIASFRKKFPESNLEEWGVSEVGDSFVLTKRFQMS